MCQIIENAHLCGYGGLSVRAKRHGGIVHDAVVVVGHLGQGGGRWDFLEVLLSALVHVRPQNVHVVVPLEAVLLVQEANRVHQLVERGARFGQARRTLQVDHLPAARPAHGSPAARVGVLDAHVVSVAAVPRHEADARQLVVDAHRRVQGVQVFCRWNKRNLIVLVRVRETKLIYS